MIKSALTFFSLTLSLPVLASTTLTCDVKLIMNSGKEVRCGSATLVWDTSWDGKTPDLSFKEGIGSCKSLTLEIGDYGADKTRHNYFLIMGVKGKNPNNGVQQATQISFYDQFPNQFNLSPHFDDSTGDYNCVLK